MVGEPSEELIAGLVAFAEGTADMVGVSGSLSEILYLNPAAKKRLGVSDITGMTTADIFSKEAFAQYYEVIRPQLLRTGEWSGIVPVRTAGGGSELMYVATVADIAPGGMINANFVYAHELPPETATHRPSTMALDEPGGVLDRSDFDTRLDEAVAAGAEHAGMSALIAVGLDLDPLVTSFGAAVSDEVMRAAIARVASVARTSDVIGRLDATSFGLLVRGLRSVGEARRIARALYDALIETPFVTAAGGTRAVVHCGFTIVETGGDVADIVRRASQPIWSAPGSASTTAPAPERLDRADTAVTMHAFRVAWSQGQICAHARPVVRLASGQVVGYEGRARWEHPDAGVLPASSFIPMIADSALASAVDLLIAREVAAVLLVSERATEPRMYTPASECLLLDVRAEQHLSEIAAAFHLRQDRVGLEIARPLLVTSSATLRDALYFLRDCGVKLVLAGAAEPDDAELARQLGLHELRLDRGVVARTADQPEARDAVAELVRRAHGHGLVVAAPGIDDAAALVRMQALGCDLGTGSLYGELERADVIE